MVMEMVMEMVMRDGHLNSNDINYMILWRKKL